MRRINSLLCCVFLSASADAEPSLWLPVENQFVLTPSIGLESYDTLRVGRDEFSLGGVARENVASLQGEYGLRDDLALDLSAGYTNVSFEPDGGRRKTASNLTDTSLGIRWRAFDEFGPVHRFPTVVLRGGAILNTSGDGTDGAETSLALGKTFPSALSSVHGRAGYRWRAGGSDVVFYSAGVSRSLGKRLFLGLSYKISRSVGGADIERADFAADPGKTALDPSSNTGSSLDAVEASVGVPFARGFHAAVFGAREFARRNSADKTRFGLTAGISF